jgi:cobalt-zinc-cadmium efflux system protein
VDAAQQRQSSRLRIVLAINLAVLIALIIVGLASHSLGVLAAAGDYVADSFAIALGLVAIRVSAHPRGYRNATSWAALINASLLLVASVIVVAEAINRLRNGTPEIRGLSTMIVSIVATVAMGVSVLILGGDFDDDDGDDHDDDDDDDDLHMKSVLLDTLADAAAAAAVAVAGGVIYFTKRFFWLDSVLAATIAVIVGYHAIKLLRKVLKKLR